MVVEGLMMEAEGLLEAMEEALEGRLEGVAVAEVSLGSRILTETRAEVWMPVLGKAMRPFWRNCEYCTSRMVLKLWRPKILAEKMPRRREREGVRELEKEKESCY